MDDEKLREEFPGNAYTDIEPSSREVPDLAPAEMKTPEPVAPKPKTRQKPEEKKRHKLTIGEKIVSRIKSIDPADIFETIVYDWVFPGIQAAGEEMLRLIFGSSRNGQSGRGRGGKSNPIYYNSIYDGARGSYRQNVGTRSSKPQVIFRTRSEAEQVLSAVAEYIDDYGQASLKDFYTLVDEITDGEISVSAEYPTRGYGWRSIETADISRVRDGFMLTMPKVEVLR